MTVVWRLIDIILAELTAVTYVAAANSGLSKRLKVLENTLEMH